MVKIAVLGCGRIGRMHAHNICQHPRASLAQVFDTHLPFAEEVAQENGVKVADSMEAVLADDNVDAVLICTATNTHADYLEMAVAAGKPVLCEKPIDLSLARVNQCRDALGGANAGKNLPIQLGFNRRFDPGHSAAQRACANGDIGELHQVIITSRDPELPPRNYLESAGGLLRDMTIHDFDLARFFLMDEPVEVFAVASPLIDPVLGAELSEVDTAMIIMRTADGKQCHINNSRTAGYGYDQRIELLGRDGMLISGNRKPHEVTHYSKQHAERSDPYLYFFIERYREAFMAEIDAFVTSVENNTPAEVGFEDGRRALILAEAAYLSIEQKRMVRVDEVTT